LSRLRMSDAARQGILKGPIKDSLRSCAGSSPGRGKLVD
jgi:hypothetical protein